MCLGPLQFRLRDGVWNTGAHVFVKRTTSHISRFWRRAIRLGRDESGLSTIEFVVWTPLFMALILFAFDVA
ncbi:MAG: hypothetical protein D6773_14720, partial [Alphaproteobacteria bacterium]